jgi:predicted transposase YdaD
MTKQSHDHNFKNLFLDFPKETLEWFFPQAEQNWGQVRKVEFIRQEPKKRKLSDPNLALDMPILFSFENQQLLLWLVEFQEDKAKFSIYKLLHYTTDLMEFYPQALVIPTVLFTDRTNWRKDVVHKLETKLNDRLFLHFEYVFFKLFDFNARDYYNINNPVVKILLPKMNYKKDERIEVIRHAYSGLFQLASRMLFDKYVDFIDVYAQISEQEQKSLYHEIIQHKETAMLAQYIREKGMQEGMQEGMQQGMQEGMQQGMLLDARDMLIEVLTERFGGISSELSEQIQRIDSREKLKDLLRQALRAKSFNEFGKKL